jgi:hypothetical protein
MRLGMPNASVRPDPCSGTHKNAASAQISRKRPIQADRHPGVRLRHLGSDPAWRGQTPKGVTDPKGRQTAKGVRPQRASRLRR